MMKTGPRRTFLYLLLATAISIMIWSTVQLYRPDSADQYRPSHNRSVLKSAMVYQAHPKAHLQALKNGTERHDTPINKTPVARRRATTVQAECSEMNGRSLVGNQVNNRAKGWIMVNDKYQLMFCQIPKVASSNIRRIFLALDDQIVKTNRSQDITAGQINAHTHDLDTLKSFSSSEWQSHHNNYTKAMVTREPFERLLSAYINKFEVGVKGRDPWSVRTRKQILNTLFTHNITTERLTHLTFEMFLRYIVLQHRMHLRLNGHWERYTVLCDPCRVGYDFVLDLDTIDTDIQLVIDDVGASNIIQMPESSHGFGLNATSNKMEEYYSTIPPGLLDQVYKVYLIDFKVFDYAVPDMIWRLIGIKN